MKCTKCNQWIVRLEDSTPDCGCYVEPDAQNNPYPALDKNDNQQYHSEDTLTKVK